MNVYPTTTKPGLLFVDDERKAHGYFARVFTENYHVRTAASAEEALGILNEPGSNILAVVADQRMPRTTGIQLFEAIKERNPTTIRILTTAYTEIDVLVQAINQGAVHAFVPKPWDLEDFTRTVDRIMERQQLAGGNQYFLQTEIEAMREAALSDRVADLGSVAADVGHYIHNALFPVSLFLERMLQRNSPTFPGIPGLSAEAGYAFVRHMMTHIREINDTIVHLQRARTPLDRDQLEELDLVAMLVETEAANRELCQNKGIGHELRIPPSPLRILGQPTRVSGFFSLIFAEQVVSLPAGSRFRVTLREATDREFVEIIMEDNEPLKEGRSAQSLFYPFNVRSEDPQEMGVFLIAVYFMVRVMGGSASTGVSPLGGPLFSYLLPKNPTVDQLARSAGQPVRSNTIRG